MSISLHPKSPFREQNGVLSVARMISVTMAATCDQLCRFSRVRVCCSHHGRSVLGGGLEANVRRILRSR
eukprot:3005987-Rhodomonas_salina.1